MIGARTVRAWGQRVAPRHPILYTLGVAMVFISGPLIIGVIINLNLRELLLIAVLGASPVICTLLKNFRTLGYWGVKRPLEAIGEDD